MGWPWIVNALPALGRLDELGREFARCTLAYRDLARRDRTGVGAEPARSGAGRTAGEQGMTVDSYLELFDTVRLDLLRHFVGCAGWHRYRVPAISRHSDRQLAGNRPRVVSSVPSPDCRCGAW